MATQRFVISKDLNEYYSISDRDSTFRSMVEDSETLLLIETQSGKLYNAISGLPVESLEAEFEAIRKEDPPPDDK